MEHNSNLIRNQLAEDQATLTDFKRQRAELDRQRAELDILIAGYEHMVRIKHGLVCGQLAELAPSPQSVVRKRTGAPRPGSKRDRIIRAAKQFLSERGGRAHRKEIWGKSLELSIRP